jgi:hypothetical protein
MMLPVKQTITFALLGFLAACAFGAGNAGFQQQVITLPSSDIASGFWDIETNGRPDLLAVDRAEGRIFVYRQKAAGFSTVADQVIQLPPQTAWFSFCAVDRHPGLALLMSTATGLVYYRQNAGVFETDERQLIKAGQVFTNVNNPYMYHLATNREIPVISPTEAVLYRRNDAFEWKPDPPKPLQTNSPNWFVSAGNWKMGPDYARELNINRYYLANRDEAVKPAPEDNTIGKLFSTLRKAEPGHWPEMMIVDLDGDGREDVVVWQVLGDFEARTDLYIFLRNADGKIPNRPTQILHCRGMPIPVEHGGTRSSPIVDLKGDGAHELVLLELKASIMSADGAIEAMLSRGMNWELAIRTFQNGAFSHNPDASIAVTGMMTGGPWEQWPSFFISGDFNGDGRPDFVVRRSAKEWDIFFSTKDGSWFERQPSLKFDAPVEGRLGLLDLNGDGRTDIISQASDDPRIFLFLSQPQPTKGNP